MSGFFSRTLDALDERTGYRALLRAAGDEPVVGGARLAYVWGSALLAAIMVQMITGWLLMTAYAPSATTAWASVHYITYRLTFGWFIRGLHHFGSGATIVLLAAHLAQTALFGAYKRPREMNWWFGLLLMAIVLGFSLTGYLLPWDQKGYWATRVATNIMGTVPLLGSVLQRLMQGGNDYGHLTLTRFYALHVGVLPALLIALLVGHIFLFRKHGVTPSPKADRKKIDRFYPKQLAYDVLASLLVVAVVVGFVLKEHGAPLDAPADPSSEYPARPEWYFLSLFQMLKYFKGALEPVGTIVLPSVAVLFLFALPLLDRKPGTAPRARLTWLVTLFAGFAALVVLGLLSSRADAHDEAFKKARQQADERAAYANQIAMNGIPPEGPLAMLEHDPKLRGEAIWAHDCAGCHTLDGKGGNSAPDLKGWGSKAWVEATMRDPDSTIRFGKSPFAGKMPSMIKPEKGEEATFKAMDDASISEVAAFVSGEGTDAERKKGKETFSVACNGCHAIDGDGGDDELDVAPDLGAWGTLHFIRAQIVDPSSGDTYKEGVSSPGFKGHMPAFGATLKDDVDVIARWVFLQTKGRAPTEQEIDAANLPMPKAPSPGSSAQANPSAGSAP